MGVGEEEMKEGNRVVRAELKRWQPKATRTT